MIKTKGQVQMGESIAVIAIVIIMLIVGISFWARVSNSGTSDINTQKQELSVIEMANGVAEFSELKCYDSDVNKVKCLDYYKIQAMANLTRGNSTVFKFYNNYFKSAKITVRKLYPLPEENITIYDANLSNHTTSLLIPIPINIKNYVTRETSYGLIIVEGYYTEKK